MVLKLSVLASGEVLLDGKHVELDQLDQALQTAKSENRLVWYYREAAAKEAPPHAMAVIQLVIKHKLPISISSKPDFSDYVDAKGVSHPRTPASGLSMPDVATPANIEEVFAKVRKAAAGATGQRGLVIVLPDRRYLLLPPTEVTPELEKIAAGLARLIPADVKRNIAVIGNTAFGTGDTAVPSLTEAGKSIPFLGLLIGLCHIGHTVWILEGHPSALEAGCREADVLIVDSGVRPLLQEGWQDKATAVMRNANILVHDRASFQLRALRKLGTSNERLEFRDQPLRA